MQEQEESAFELVQPLAETGKRAHLGQDGNELLTRWVGGDSRASKWKCRSCQCYLLRNYGWLCRTGGHL